MGSRCQAKLGGRSFEAQMGGRDVIGDLARDPIQHHNDKARAQQWQTLPT